MDQEQPLAVPCAVVQRVVVGRGAVAVRHQSDPVVPLLAVQLVALAQTVPEAAVVPVLGGG